MDNLQLYTQDFSMLTKLKAFITNEIQNTQNHEIFDGFHMTYCQYDGRQMRRIYPHGAMEFKSDIDGKQKYPYCFVGFFGNSLIRDEAYRKRMWDSDDDLIEELKRHPGICCYTSSEVDKGSEDWYNLVLLKSPAAVDQWHQSDIHSDIVRDIAPNVYSKVRIHFGVLENGILQNDFKVVRTTFLDYNVLSVSGGTEGRKVVKWDENSQSGQTTITI